METMNGKVLRGFFDEIEYAMEVLDDPEMINDNTYQRIICLVRYFKNFPDEETGKMLTKNQIEQRIDSIIDEYGFSSETSWYETVGKLVNRYTQPSHKDIVEVQAFHFNYSELEKIRELNDDKKERIMFLILLFAKAGLSVSNQKKELKGIDDTKEEIDVEAINKQIDELNELMLKDLEAFKRNRGFEKLRDLKRIKNSNKIRCWGFKAKEKFIFQFAGYKYKRDKKYKNKHLGVRDMQRCETISELIELGYIEDRNMYDIAGLKSAGKDYVFVNIAETEIKDGIDIDVTMENLKEAVLYYDLWRGEKHVAKCQECGELFRTKSTGRPPKYCDKCADKVKKLNDKIRIANKRSASKK